MKTKKEIDRDYYLHHKEEIKKRNACYQKKNPERHRIAAREYERRKRAKLKFIPILGNIISDEKLGNKIIFNSNNLNATP